MATKTIPKFKLQVYGQGAVPILANPVAITDILAHSLTRGNGDNVGIFPLAGTSGIATSLNWASLNLGQQDAAFTNITNLSFARLLGNGTVTSAPPADRGEAATDRYSCFYIIPRVAFLDNIMAGSTLSTGLTALHWQPVSGTWKTSYPTTSPRFCQIFNSGSDELAQVITVGNLPANRSIGAVVRFIGQGQSNTDTPGFRLALPGGQISVSMRHGQLASVDRMVSGQWAVWDSIAALGPCDLAGGFYEMAIVQLAGYLLVNINGNSIWLANVASGTPAGNVGTTSVTWPSGQLSANVWNCKALFGIATIQWDDLGGSPLTGSFTRYYAYQPTISGTFNAGNVQATGNVPTGTTIVPSDPVVVSNISISETVTLSNGTNGGINTPSVNKLFISQDGTENSPSASAVDITPALVRGQLEMAQPPILPGAQMTLEINRQMLDQMFGNTGWQQYIDRYLPISFSLTWSWSNGETGLDAPGDGLWVQLFTGYILSPAKNTVGSLQNMMTLTCRDPVLRLTGEHMLVDSLFLPGDFLFFNKIAANPNNAVLYGSDIVSYILSTSLGATEAARLITYLPPSIAPVFSNNNDICGYATSGLSIGQQNMPLRNGFQVPPPFKSDALTWINNIGHQYDSAIFYYGWPVGNIPANTLPSPIYAQQEYLVKQWSGQPTFVIPDRAYASGDDVKLLTTADVAYKTEGDINVFEVIGNVQGSSAAADWYLAQYVAQSQLPAGDPYNDPAQTWARKMIQTSPLALYPEVAQAIAIAEVILQAGRNPQFPTIEIQRGQYQLQWGQRVQVHQVSTSIANPLQSDISLGVNGITFRTEKVVHSFSQAPGDFGLKSFSTKLWATGLSTVEM